MASLNKKPGYEAKLPRTSHDISRQIHYTSTVGHILPVYHHLLNPSDHIEMEINQFTRSLYLNTATMAQIDFKIDVFFVPMTMLYTPFENMFYGTDDFISSAAWQSYDTDFMGLPDYDMYQPSRVLFPTVQDVAADPKRFKDIYRLFMHLGYNPNCLMHEFASTSQGGSGNVACYYNTQTTLFFPYALLAYNAIWKRYYRLEDWEVSQCDIYNFDRFGNRVVTMPSLDLLKEFLTLRCVPRYKDYFTRVRNNVLASSVSMEASDGLEYLTKINSFLAYDSNYLANPDGASEPNPFTATSIGDSEAIVSTGIIRNVFAAEKLLRIFGRAQKTYDSQILAHFGWKVPHDVKHQLTYLGSFSNSLEINQVTATAATDNAALGSITGTGFTKGMQGKKIKFTAPVHGCLMVLAYSRPKTPYEMSFDKINQITTRLDFPQPEFMDLGAQPMYCYEADINFMDAGLRGVRIGWQYRYEQFKSKYDCYTVAFADPTHSPVGLHSNNAFQSWIVGRKPFRHLPVNGSTYLPVDDLFVNSHDIDQIMAIPYSDNYTSDWYLKPWLMFQTDPFINWCDVHCTLVSFMSKYGEPELDA